MKQRRKNILLGAGLILIMLLSIVAYSRYTQRQIYHESTQNLLSTYGQVSKTFTMFVQRNWNILEIWSEDLAQLAEETNTEVKWRRYVNEKANWQYSEVTLFNADDQFWTVSGRRGDAPHMQSALEEVYTMDGPIVTSYISSMGVRKVMFAQQIEPVTMDGVTYTSLAICYDNSVLENMLGGLAYEGQSDCYIVRSNGNIVLSTEPRSEIPEQMTNLFDYLEANVKADQPYFDEMRKNLPLQHKGSVGYTFNRKRYYMVYQPVGVKDWAIIGIVPTNVVDAGMRRVQMFTIALLAVLSLMILGGTGKIFYDKAKTRKEKAEAERMELQRRKELTEQMFHGMARIVDRFVVCDLENDHYEYHERRGKELYPTEGSYLDLLSWLSRQYVILTDGENAKLVQMLAPKNLRAQLKEEKDSIKFEYATRDRKSFLMMTVVPVGWQNGRLTQIIMISQDMSGQHILQDLANTDGLTGLLNKRYFDAVTRALVHRGQAFVLFYLDLDRFKPVNDTYGHEVGDKLLQEVAKRLQSCIRNQDYAFRMGGDEFALLTIGAMSPEEARRKVEFICKTVAAPYHVAGSLLTIGTSCGFALYPEEGTDTVKITRLADQRMYKHKQKNHALQDHGLYG